MADRLDSEISRKLWEDVFVKAHERARAPPSLLADGLQETLIDEGMLGDERSWPRRRQQNRVVLDLLGFDRCIQSLFSLFAALVMVYVFYLSACPLLWKYCFRSHM